jgi:hypothetical protein
MRRDPTRGTRGSFRGAEDSKTKAFAGLHLVFNRRTLPNVFFPGTGGADWSRGVRHIISDHGRIFEMGRSVGQQFVEQTA